MARMGCLAISLFMLFHLLLFSHVPGVHASNQEPKGNTTMGIHDHGVQSRLERRQPSPLDRFIQCDRDVLDDIYSGQTAFHHWYFAYPIDVQVKKICENKSLSANFSGEYTVPDHVSMQYEWHAMGDRCHNSCEEMFEALLTAPKCRYEGYWVNARRAITLPNCGRASFIIMPAFQNPPRTGRCTGAEPAWAVHDKSLLRQFCPDTVAWIKEQEMSFWGPARARHGFWKSYGVDEKAMYRVEDGEDAEGRPGVVHVLVMPDLDGCPDVPGDEDRWETARKRLEKLDVGECESAMHVLRIGWCDTDSKVSGGISARFLSTNCLRWGFIPAAEQLGP